MPSAWAPPDHSSEPQSWTTPNLGAFTVLCPTLQGSCLHCSSPAQTVPAICTSLWLLWWTLCVLANFGVPLDLLQSYEERFGFQYLNKYYLGRASWSRWSCVVFHQWSPVWAAPVFWHAVSYL